MNWKKEYTLLTAILVCGALLRLATQSVPNFAPITAMALFGAAFFGSRTLALLVPAATLLLSDVLMEIAFRAGVGSLQGFYPGMYWQYAAFGLVGLAGMALLRRVSAGRVLAASLAGSVIFFVVTNAGCWLVDMGNIYADDLSGLWASLVAGLPFAKFTLLGDLFFTSVFIGGYSVVRSRYLATASAKA